MSFCGWQRAMFQLELCYLNRNMTINRNLSIILSSTRFVRGLFAKLSYEKYM